MGTSFSLFGMFDISEDAVLASPIMKRRRAPFKIPSEVLIRGRRWRVRRFHELDVDDQIEIQGFDGLALRDRHEIQLGVHASPHLEASTFLHELLHACADGSISDRSEEKFIRDIERPLFRALSQLKWRSGHG